MQKYIFLLLKQITVSTINLTTVLKTIIVKPLVVPFIVASLHRLKRITMETLTEKRARLINLLWDETDAQERLSLIWQIYNV